MRREIYDLMDEWLNRGTDGFRMYTLDLIGKKTENGQNTAQTPMQWTTEPHEVFSTIDSWIDVNQNYTHINVAAVHDAQRTHYSPSD